MKITPLKVLRIDADKTLSLSVAFLVYRKCPGTGFQSFRWGRKTGKVEYNVMEGKPYVMALAGLEDDPETGTFWFLYVKTINSDEEPQIIEQSPVDVKLKPNQEIILWYKSGSWNPHL
ncbi:uncharacterized protein TNCV_1174951 [Trichonephila clavipes]|nr:uncharacterized protein TNCV_1174951 [Trichonephila clavipes]